MGKIFLFALIFFVVVLFVPRRFRRVSGLAVSAAFIIITPLLMPKFQNDLFGDFAVYIMAAISLNMLIGMSGQISLGHGALMAIGAYTVGIMVQQHHVSFYIAALVGALLATLVGLLLGLPATRLTGPYLAIATLGLAISLPAIGKWSKVSEWTGASQGIQIRPKFLPTVPDWLTHFPHHHLQPDEFQALLALGVAAICGVLVFNVSRSRSGRALRALRDSEPAAKVMGINLAHYKVLAFVMSAYIAGLSGAFLAFSTGGVHPDTFGLNLSIAILAMIVIGGLDSILGSILGAIIVRVMLLNSNKLPAPTDIPVLGSHLSATFKSFPIYAAGVYYGLFLILVMILMPFGIAGAYYRLLHYPYRDRFFRRHGPQSMEPAEETSPFARPPTTRTPNQATDLSADLSKEVTRS